MHDYYYGAQANQFSFIRVPTILFTDDQYKYVSAEAKVLYGILLRRMDLSAKNGWIDEKGRVYIICTVSEIMETMNCADNKVSNGELREAETADCFRRPCLPDRAVGSAKARC